jgi:hypothetical protein
MKRKTALVAGLAVLLLLVAVALALEFWPCPKCSYTPMTAHYTCPNHVPPYPMTGPAYIDPNHPTPPPYEKICPICDNPVEADSVVCPNCGRIWPE